MCDILDISVSVSSIGFYTDITKPESGESYRD